MRVFKYLAAHWRTILVIVVLLLIQAFCDLALPRYTAGIVDVGILQFGIEDISEGQAEQFARAIANQDYSTLGFDPQQTQLNYLLSVGAQMLGITALGALAAIAISFLASRTAATIAHDLRQRLFERVVSFADAEVQHFSAASLITRSTNDVQQIQQTCMIAMRMVLFAPMMAIGGIIMVLSTDVSMSWIIVLAIVVVIASIGTLMAIAMPKFKIMQTLIDKVNLVAREIITGLPVIRAFNRQDYEKKRFDEASTKLMRTQLFTTRTMTIMMPVVQLVMNGVSALIVWTAAGYIDAGGSSIALTGVRNGRRALVVVLGSSTTKERDQHARTLMVRALEAVAAPPKETAPPAAAAKATPPPAQDAQPSPTATETAKSTEETPKPAQEATPSPAQSSGGGSLALGLILIFVALGVAAAAYFAWKWLGKGSREEWEFEDIPTEPPSTAPAATP